MQTRSHAAIRYAESQFVREPAAWATIRTKGESLRPGMQMSAYEGALLHWLLAQHKAKRVLEIGSFMGLTALWMARALPKDGTLVTLEREAAYAACARNHVAGDPRIRVEEGDALLWLKATQEAPFDVLFIDGEKKAYADYLEAALPHLAPGALVIADNTLLFGAMLGEEEARTSAAAKEAMTRFHALLADDTRFRSILLPTPEGLTLATVL